MFCQQGSQLVGIAAVMYTTQNKLGYSYWYETCLVPTRVGRVSTLDGKSFHLVERISTLVDRVFTFVVKMFTQLGKVDSGSERGSTCMGESGFKGSGKGLVKKNQPR